MFSASESLNLLIKCFEYIRFLYASPIFAHIERKDLLFDLLRNIFLHMGKF